MITICSVYHSSETKKLVEMNYGLTKKKNPGVDFSWVLAENAPEDLLDKMPRNGNFTVIPGPEGGLEKMYSIYPRWIASTFLHNGAMNMSIPHIKTRFGIFLDSDFYILEPNWIKKAIDHMQKNNLTFLGTPWHPKDYIKFRYFPCHQCLFVDFEKLKENGYKPEDIDFNPTGYGNSPGEPPKKRFGKLSRIINMFNFSERRKIGTDKHTAHGVFEKFHKDGKTKFKVIPAVFKPEKESYPALNLVYIFNKFFEFFLPDKFCYIPKDTSYYSTKSFKDRGYGEIFGEEFIWKDKPFAIHVRLQKKMQKGATLPEIEAILNELFQRFN